MRILLTYLKWISNPEPDIENQVTFNKFDDPEINLWLKKNKTRFLLEDREPGAITTYNWG